MLKSRPFCSATGRKVRSTYSCDLGERDVASASISHLAGFDLGQIEDLVDQVQQVAAGGVDGLGELDLLGRQVAVLVVGQQLRQDQQAVERRAQLVRHVRQELGLVLGDERELLGLLFERGARQFDFAVLQLDLVFCSASSVAFSSSSLRLRSRARRWSA